MKRYTLVIICLTLLTVVISVEASAQISALEREALIVLYSSTNGDSWSNNSGWKDGTLHTDGFTELGTEGSWFGIALNPEENNVLGITLYNNNLVGTIPTDLNNLTNLQTLDLSINQLSGSIPTELGDLTHLEVIWLGANQLSGSIPTEFGNLASLKFLSLGSNQLAGSIPSALGDLTSLYYIELHSNQLTDSIPAALGNLTNLHTLDLSINQLSGSIPKKLGDLTNMRYLGLENNSLAGPIPAEIINLTSLVDAKSDFRNNCLFTSDSDLRDFLNTKQMEGDWESSQGVLENVPNVSDITQASAESAITAEGLSVGEITTACSDTISEGSVIRSNPAAGNSVCVSTMVNLVVSDGPCPNVITIQAYGTDDSITLESPSGTALNNCLGVDNPSPGDTPEGISFLYGFFSFTIDGIDSGGGTTMTITLPDGANPTSYYKYGPTPDNPLDHWYDFIDDGETGAVINGNIITLYFVDGKRGDSDLDTNGTIVDPGGPAIIDTPATPAAAGGGGCFIGSLTQ